jgi:hypothetical protein
MDCRLHFMGCGFNERHDAPPSQVWEISKRTGRPFPRHLVIQSDNTVSQAKNETVMLWLAWLVAEALFETANLFFLRVGHTHEDIDHLFGIVCTLVHQSLFETPEELMDFLAVSLAERFQKKGEELTCSMVSDIRNPTWLVGMFCVFVLFV